MTSNMATPMEVARSPKYQISGSSNVGMKRSHGGSKLLPGMELSPRTQKLASANTETPNKQQSQMETQTELELVRSKLRESLASALATGSKEQSKSRVAEKNSFKEDNFLLKEAKVSSLQNSDPPAHVGKLDGDQTSTFEDGSSGNLSVKKVAGSIYNEQEGNKKHDGLSTSLFTNISTMEDELLQGLRWTADNDSLIADSIQAFDSKKPKLVYIEEDINMKDTQLRISEDLSVQIEGELFKLFGGVNKKYKEKGRSLLFNLKDSSNPELRERVLSGDLSPERLCSMTAEELASKELSQWRQAKAEEFAHMVMLPEMNIDIRRLVRKTHKGEFQVEVEQDVGDNVEVEPGSDVQSMALSEFSAKNDLKPKSTDEGLTLPLINELEMSDDLLPCAKFGSYGRNAASSLDFSMLEKTDYTHQELMPEEYKDTEFLSPVVSLDEFMQALDSEPPFENLKIDNLQETSSCAYRDMDRSGHKADSTSEISAIKVGNGLKSQLQSDDACEEQVNQAFHSASERNDMWEGYLQLNISALSNVVGHFISGERTSMQGWPNILEVKGRVRLEAFEKFLQELPLSRSRAVMLIELCWKEDSLESGRAHLSEVIHSYITDERLGFAEPVPGVEIYLCPSHPKISGILSKHLSKELLDSINRSVHGLVGIVVWRKPNVIISPRLSSRHKHGSSKRSGSKRSHESKKHFGSDRAKPHKHLIPDDEDDVPPGFGPPISKDDDDLPEFDFSRSIREHSAMVGQVAGLSTTCSTNHSRELIQKYGQSKAREIGIPVQPWNDDDDDIPEWNPAQLSNNMPQSAPPPTPLPPPPPPPQLHVYEQNLMPTNMQYLQRPLHATIQPHPLQNVMQPPAAVWWPGAHGMPDGCTPLGNAYPPCHFGGHLSGARPQQGLGPRTNQGFGGPRNELGSWRPTNFGNKGV